MRYSRASIAFATFLAATLAVKALASEAVPEPDRTAYLRAAGAMMRDSGFEIVVQDRRVAPVVYASAGGCRMLLADYSPYGTTRAAIQRLASRVGPIRFAYRGALRDEAPKLVPLTEYYIQRELRRIGVPVERHPIVAVAANGDCAVERLDWSRLANVAY